MTEHQQAQLDRAITRAREEGIAIIARGIREYDGAAIYLVASASVPGLNYLVAIYRNQLTCTCPAGKQGAICKHRGLVHDTLRQERSVALAS